MSATITIKRFTGSGPTGTDVTSTNSRIDASDSNSTGSTSNPITIPPSGTNYSYWGVYRLHCSVAPVSSVSNFKIYGSGTNSLGTGIGMNIGQATSYIQATGSTGNGTQLTTGNYSTLTGSPVNFFSYTSGSPLSLTASTSSTGDFGNYFVLQFTVASTAGAGPTAAQPQITISYDES
jgi:hypothetical protein